MKKLIVSMFAVSLFAVLMGCQNPVGDQTKSNNGELSSLTVSIGTLSPTFAVETTAYTVSVANSTTNITITGTKADSNATLSSNNGVAQSLNVGTNTITITVTAEDGITSKSYIVQVYRDPEMIVNSNFISGFSSWNPWETGLEGASAIWEIRDGCAWAHDIVIGPNSWDLQLMTAAPILLVNGNTYILKIVSGSKSDRNFKVKIGENGTDFDNDGSSYTPYVSFDYSTYDESVYGGKQTSIFEFLYSNPTNQNAQLNIEFGSSNINFEIQEISLKEKQ